MAKAQKLPSGSWRIRIGAGESGKTVSFTAPTKKEVEIKAAEYLTGKRHPERRTVEELTKEYIDSRRNILSPSTIKGYECIAGKNLLPISGVRLCDLGKNDIQRWIDQLSVTASPKSVANAFGLLRSVIIYAAGDFDYNVALPKIQKQIRELPPTEKIINAVRGTDIELPCMLAIWLGLRMSEIRGLRKKDIAGNVLTVSEAVITVGGEHIRKKTTKTYRARRLRVPEYILALIAEIPPDQEEITRLSAHAIYQKFSRLLQKNEIEHITFHDLRHLNASVMAALGVPEKYAMERGGWSSPSIMREVYQHTFSAQADAVADQMDDYFNSIVPKT